MLQIRSNFVGFDARTPIPTWDLTAEQRQLYLYRLDCDPRTVDSLVWPSLLDFPEEEQWQLHQGLCPDWAMFQRYRAKQLREVANIVLRISRFEMGEGPSVPVAEQPDRFTLYGYDVADDGLISGLMDCGRWKSESEIQRWRDRLNEHHLFADMSDAFEFVDFCNEDIPSHAPFFVFSLEVLEVAI